MKTASKLIVGIGIPYALVIGLLPWVGSSDASIFGVPLLYAWIFGCFILTSACLYACWLLFDRDAEAVE